MKRRDFLGAIAAALPLPFLRFPAAPVDGGFIVPGELQYAFERISALEARHTVMWRINPEMLRDVDPSILDEVVRDEFTKQLREREVRALLDGTGSAEPRGFLSSRRLSDVP